MDETSLAVLYLIAAVLFILSLGGLSHQETARRGNTWGIVGMSIALIGTLLHPHVERYELIGPAILGGALIGAVMAIRVAYSLRDPINLQTGIPAAAPSPASPDHPSVTGGEGQCPPSHP